MSRIVIGSGSKGSLTSHNPTRPTKGVYVDISSMGRKHTANGVTEKILRCRQQPKNKQKCGTFGNNNNNKIRNNVDKITDTTTTTTDAAVISNNSIGSADQRGLLRLQRKKKKEKNKCNESVISYSICSSPSQGLNFLLPLEDASFNTLLDKAWWKFGEACVFMQQNAFQEAWKSLLEAKGLIDASKKCVDCDVSRHNHALLQLGHELNEVTTNWLGFKGVLKSKEICMHGVEKETRKESSQQNNETNERGKDKEDKRREEQDDEVKKDNSCDSGAVKEGCGFLCLTEGLNVAEETRCRQGDKKVDTFFVDILGVSESDNDLPCNDRSDLPTSQKETLRQKLLHVDNNDEESRTQARFGYNVICDDSNKERVDLRQPLLSATNKDALCYFEQQEELQDEGEKRKEKVVEEELKCELKRHFFSEFTPLSSCEAAKGIENYINNDTLPRQTLSTALSVEANLGQNDLHEKAERHGKMSGMEATNDLPTKPATQSLQNKINTPPATDNAATCARHMFSKEDSKLRSIFSLGEPRVPPLYAFEIEKPRPMRSDIVRRTSGFASRLYSFLPFNYGRKAWGRSPAYFSSASADRENTEMRSSQRVCSNVFSPSMPSYKMRNAGNVNGERVENNLMVTEDSKCGCNGGDDNHSFVLPRGDVYNMRQWSRTRRTTDVVASLKSQAADSAASKTPTRVCLDVCKLNRRDGDDDVASILRHENGTMTTEAVLLRCFDAAKSYQDACNIHKEMVQRLLIQRAKEERDECEKEQETSRKNQSLRASYLLGRLEEVYYDWLIDHLGIKKRCLLDDNMSTANITNATNSTKDQLGDSSQCHTNSCKLTTSPDMVPLSPQARVPSGRLEAALVFSRTSSFSASVAAKLEEEKNIN